MSYIGDKPSQTLASPTSQYFNGTGSQTVFTLNRLVNVSEDLEVFVNNIQQEPGAGKSYTATGSTMTFDAAPSAGTNNVYVVYRGLAEVTTRLEIDPNSAISATTGTFTGDLTVDTDTLYVDSANNRVGIGTTSPPDHLAVVTSGANAQLSVDRSDGATGRTVLIHSTSGGQLQTTGSVPLIFGTADIERGRFLAGGGLTFNGDTAAANALDDYEEGTLVPTLSCTGGNTGIVYAAQVGRYVKIGNMVHVNLYLELSSKGSASGNVRISGAGFPFTPINTTGFVQVGQVSLNGTVNGQQFDGSNDIWGQLSPGDATLRIYADSDGDVVQLDTGDISGTSFRVNISYFV